MGIFSLTGCGGDQLMILNLEDFLLELLNKFEIKSFQEASSYEEEVPLDIAFVEGSISSKADLKKLEQIRRKSKMLVAIGDCAVGGCVQAMRNNQMTMAEKMRKVYNVEEDYYDVLEPKGLAEYVKVDLEVPGCPIETSEIFWTITSLLHGDMPEQMDYPVCTQCKLKGYLCVLVEKGMPCLGPMIIAGCEARCPSLNLDCVGCRGLIPNESNAPAELVTLLHRGFGEKYIRNRLRFFCGNSEDIAKLTEMLTEKSKSKSGEKKKE